MPHNSHKKVAENKLALPSFNQTTALFAQHFSILRELKKNIDDLKKKRDISDEKSQNVVIDEIIN